MSKGTVHRTVRIEDGLWSAAKAKADQRGENLSDVIRRALALYAEDRHPKPAEAVTAAGLEHIDNCPECRARYL